MFSYSALISTLFQLVPFVAACWWLMQRNRMCHSRIYRYGGFAAMDLGDAKVVNFSHWLIIGVYAMIVSSFVLKLLYALSGLNFFYPELLFTIALSLYGLHRLVERKYCADWYSRSDKESCLF